jgi:hypothetical protein
LNSAKLATLEIVPLSASMTWETPVRLTSLP